MGGLSQKRAVSGGRLPIEGNLPSMAGSTGWLNTEPINAGSMRGKIVLVDFCTYTCINWQRQLPYIRAWATRYRQHGLIVIGVHTPEFSFEKDLQNIRRAITEMHIEYPIAIDSNYMIWKAFDNEYWPALYLFDHQGRLRHHVFGEGQYEDSERAIQELLKGLGKGAFDTGFTAVHPTGSEAQADWSHLSSPENYVSYRRTEGFVSAGGAVPEKAHEYSIPAALELNEWALGGTWTMQREATVLNEAGGRIAYRFHARDLHLVMGPGHAGPVRFRVLVDEQPAGSIHGIDVDDQGNGSVTYPRMYQLVRQKGTITDRRFEIEFLDPGVETYSFTFG